jgi:hypothetical protein
MQNNLHIKQYLDLGVFLRVYCDDKFVYLLNDRFFKELKICNNKKPKNKYYDIIFMKEFDIDNVKITAYDFFYLPEKNSLDYFVKNNIKIYKFEKLCKKNTITYIKNLKKQTRFLYKQFLKDFSIKTEDDLIVKFYPNHNKNKKQNFKKNLKDFFYEFYYKNKTELIHDEKIQSLDGFLILGVAKENVNCCDPIFIKSLKNCWFQKILQEKNKAINELKNIDNSFLPETDKIIFEQEINEFIILLENTIKIENMNDLKTPIDIISYWPEVLPNIPYYVHR